MCTQLSVSLEEFRFGQTYYTNLDIVTGTIRYEVATVQAEEIKSIQVRLEGTARTGKSRAGGGIVYEEKLPLIDNRYIVFPDIGKNAENMVCLDTFQNSPQYSKLTKGTHEYPFVLIFPDRSGVSEDQMAFNSFRRRASFNDAVSPGSLTSVGTASTIDSLPSVVEKTVDSVGPKSYNLPPSFEYISPDGTFASVEYNVVVTVEKRISLIRNMEITSSRNVQFIPQNANLSLPSISLPNPYVFSANGIKPRQQTGLEHYSEPFSVSEVNMNFNFTRKGQIRETAKEKNNKFAMSVNPLAKTRLELHMHLSTVPFLFQISYNCFNGSKTHGKHALIATQEKMQTPKILGCRIIKPGSRLTSSITMSLVTSDRWLSYLGNKSLEAKIILQLLKVAVVSCTSITYGLFSHEEEEESQILFDKSHLLYPIDISDFVPIQTPSKYVIAHFPKGSPHQLVIPPHLLLDCYFTQDFQSFVCQTIQRKYYLKVVATLVSFSGDITTFKSISPFIFLRNEE